MGVNSIYFTQMEVLLKEKPHRRSHMIKIYSPPSTFVLIKEITTLHSKTKHYTFKINMWCTLITWSVGTFFSNHSLSLLTFWENYVGLRFELCINLFFVSDRCLVEITTFFFVSWFWYFVFPYPHMIKFSSDSKWCFETPEAFMVVFIISEKLDIQVTHFLFQRQFTKPT